MGFLDINKEKGGGLKRGIILLGAVVVGALMGLVSRWLWQGPQAGINGLGRPEASFFDVVKGAGGAATGSNLAEKLDTGLRRYDAIARSGGPEGNGASSAESRLTYQENLPYYESDGALDSGAPTGSRNPQNPTHFVKREKKDLLPGETVKGLGNIDFKKHWAALPKKADRAEKANNADEEADSLLYVAPDKEMTKSMPMTPEEAQMFNARQRAKRRRFEKPKTQGVVVDLDEYESRGQ